MARVTVEDCIQQVPNRFELVMLAGQRAREISAGSQLTVDRDNDKNPVVALREIADESIDLAALRDELIRGHQKVVEVDEPEEDIIELMAGEQGWVAQQEAGAGGDAIADESPEDDLQELDESAQPFGEDDVDAAGSLDVEED